MKLHKIIKDVEQGYKFINKSNKLETLKLEHNIEDRPVVEHAELGVRSLRFKDFTTDWVRIEEHEDRKALAEAVNIIYKECEHNKLCITCPFYTDKCEIECVPSDYNKYILTKQLS